MERGRLVYNYWYFTHQGRWDNKHLQNKWDFHTLGQHIVERNKRFHPRRNNLACRDHFYRGTSSLRPCRSCLLRGIHCFVLLGRWPPLGGRELPVGTRGSSGREVGWDCYSLAEHKTRRSRVVFHPHRYRWHMHHASMSLLHCNVYHPVLCSRLGLVRRQRWVAVGRQGSTLLWEYIAG